MNKFSRSNAPVRTVSQQETTFSSVYEEFIKNLGKYSVQSERSMHDEINSILNGTKQKYSNVEEAVQDMKERSGLTAFMNAKHALAFIQEPAIFQKIPQMKAFIDNFVEARPGTSIESVCHDLLKMDDIRSKLEDPSQIDGEVRSYINSQIAKHQSEASDFNAVNMHIGEIDTSSPEENNDPLAICEPNASK